jgi:DNA-binding MarR family transcriptional regulator
MTTASSPSLEQLYQRPGFLLRRAHQLSVGIFEEECRAVELTPAQYGALVVLANADGIDQSSVSRALGFDRVTTMHVVRGLEKRGLVTRTPSPSHGRKLELSLTPEGQRVLGSARRPAEQAFHRLVEPLTPDEAEQLNALLYKLCAGLEPVARSRILPPGY